MEVFQVFCLETCRDVSIDLRYQGYKGAELYAKEGSPPRINSQNSGCNDCLCKHSDARRSVSCLHRDTCVRRDTCVQVTTSGVNNFYTAVYARNDYSNGNLTFDGPNFNYTITDDDDSLTMTTLAHEGSGAK
jgi:hypothetical protein